MDVISAGSFLPRGLQAQQRRGPDVPARTEPVHSPVAPVQAEPRVGRERASAPKRPEPVRQLKFEGPYEEVGPGRFGRSIFPQPLYAALGGTPALRQTRPGPETGRLGVVAEAKAEAALALLQSSPGC